MKPVKDLVDLVVLILTQTIDGGRLEVVITREAASRGLPLPETFTAPPDWDASYRRLASPSRTARTTSPSHWPRTSSMSCWNRCWPGRPKAYGGIPGFAHGFEPAWERNTRSSARHG